MRAIIYARVSTEEQGDNFSIPSQIAAARRHASDRGWQIVAELSDTMSGALLDRPALRQARDLIQARAVDAVIVYSLDRLSRNVAHMLLLRDEMHAARVELHAVTRGQSADTAEGRLFDTIESAFAEFERLKIRERSMRGKRQKVQEGRILGQGVTPPYGYRYAGSGRDKTLIVNDAEAVWARQIFTWASEGVPLRAIAARLDAANVAAPGDTRHKRARGWHHATIAGIIRNPAYRGEQLFAAYNASVPVPALVDDALWQAANAQLERNKQNACRTAKRFYPLRTRVRCAACGGACSGNTVATRAGKKHHYYACNSDDRESGRRCEKPSFARAERLEAAVWQWVVENVLDETRLMEAIDRASAGEQDRRAELERERAAYARQITDEEAKIGKLIELYAASALSLEQFTQYKQRHDAAIDAARRELARVDALLADDRQRRIDRNAVLALARELRAALAGDVTPEEQARVYQALDLRVTASRDTARVEVRLTGDAEELRVLSRQS